MLEDHLPVIGRHRLRLAAQEWNVDTVGRIRDLGHDLSVVGRGFADLHLAACIRCRLNGYLLLVSFAACGRRARRFYSGPP
jgi:hypothetical protein